MANVKWNIVSNFATSFTSAVLNLAFVPIYLRYIGQEGYGLIGFFSSLGAALTILDGGLGAAAARELASNSGKADEEASRASRELSRTLEILFWLVAVSIGVALVGAAGWIAQHWLNADELSPDAATRSLRLLGASFALQWPASLYGGCLVALQRQVRLNVALVLTNFLRSIGAVAVLELVSPSIEAFFAWQVVAAAITVGALRWMLWRSLPQGPRPGFSWQRLRATWRFAAGVGSINVLAMLLTQGDKILLSKLLTLAQFGRYSLAWTLATTVYRLTSPIFNAMYPRMTQLLAAGDTQGVRLTYERGCQIMAVVVIPASLLLSCFSEPLVLLWTHDAALAADTRWVVALLAAGTMLNGVMQLPYGLLLAHGNTRIPLVANAIAVTVLLPTTYVLATSYGGIGAACTWLLLNIGYVFGMGEVTHRLFAPGHFLTWLLRAVTLPIAASLLVFLGLAPLVPTSGLLGLMISIGAIYVLGLAAASALSLRVLVPDWYDQVRRRLSVRREG